MSELAQGSAVALVVGASGGIGRAVLNHYLADSQFEQVMAVSRSRQPVELAHHGARLRWLVCDYAQASIDDVLCSAGDVHQRLSRVIICNGLLHNDRVKPEKSLLKLNAAAMQEVLHANVVVPSLWVAGLSKPFQRGGAPGKLFSAAFVAGKLATLLDEVVPDSELSYLAWDGSGIAW